MGLGKGKTYQQLMKKLWRREWDSNPRYAFTHTRFPSVRLKPLGHLSSAFGLLTRHLVRRKPNPIAPDGNRVNEYVTNP